jgi:hypothetical protein
MYANRGPAPGKKPKWSRASYLEDREHAEFLKNWREGLAATNADEIKQLRRGQTLSSIPRRRQKGWDNYENRGLREGETDDCLRLGRVIQS